MYVAILHWIIQFVAHVQQIQEICTEPKQNAISHWYILLRNVTERLLLGPHF